jgi:hypothetical protein
MSNISDHKGKKTILTSTNTNVLGLNYYHISFTDGDELYLTDRGYNLKQNLMPENYFTDKEWFVKNSQKQHGSSTVYKIKTKTVSGQSLNIVMKWNRMGIDLPGVPDEISSLDNARFLSPFEEFSILREFRESLHDPHSAIELQIPLAIFVPSTKSDSSDLGRRKYLMDSIQLNHNKDIFIDPERNYAVIYKWLEGMNIVQAYREGYAAESDIETLTTTIDAKIQDYGFIVRDHKPEHIIVNPIGKSLMKDGESDLVCGYVDYELLERLPSREDILRKDRRHNYLVKMPKRFEHYYHSDADPAHVSIFQVPYIYGEAPSTGGRLWVVGNDPTLFDYYLPEKWRHVKRTKLSSHHDIFYKISRDEIHLVLKVSKIGELPDVDPFNDHEKVLSEYGFNSPFEEVSLALELNSYGISAIYPRAIYMTGSKTKISDLLFDDSRYTSHSKLVDPIKKQNILQRDHTYIIIWGYWNGTDEMLAGFDGNYYTGINALNAYRQHLISKDVYFQIMHEVKNKLLDYSIEDLNFRGTHILLSLDANQKIVTDEKGVPRTRICNFEFLKRAVS